MLRSWTAVLRWKSAVFRRKAAVLRSRAAVFRIRVAEFGIRDAIFRRISAMLRTKTAVLRRERGRRRFCVETGQGDHGEKINADCLLTELSPSVFLVAFSPKNAFPQNVRKPAPVLPSARVFNILIGNATITKLATFADGIRAIGQSLV